MPETELMTKSAAHVRRMERVDRPLSLQQIKGPGTGRSFLLDKREIVVGRAPDAEVHVPSDRVSRRHASLECKGGEYVIRDADSANGVFLNGIKVHSAVLREGDLIQAGDAAFIYREG